MKWSESNGSDHFYFRNKIVLIIFNYLYMNKLYRMKVLLSEKQFTGYLNFLYENMELEGRNITNQKAFKEKVQPLIDDLEKKLYGDNLGSIDKLNTQKYELDNNPVIKTMQFQSGLFSIGNAKLSDDTLIINFTSALKCPSVEVCPVTQLACYAVASEMRLPNVRRKNLMIQNMWINAIKNKAIGEVFGIAQMYVEVTQKSKKPIKYVRFNEVGDFVNQDILDSAALFAKVIKEKYGVVSMAYTANKFLDFTKEIEGLPIDKIIKINASRFDIKLSNDSAHNNFLATDMDFKNVLAQNDKVMSISDSEIIKNHFECLGVLKDPETGIPSIPVLTTGKWTGGSGWYYVCPCSFWRYNKDKCALKILKQKGIVKHDVDFLTTRELSDIIKTLPDELKKMIRSKTNTIKSPCGTKCAVCHNMNGGVSKNDSKYDPDKWTYIKNYTVLEATHGATSGKYNSEYANAKRNGNDNVIYSPENPRGRITKYKE